MILSGEISFPADLPEKPGLLWNKENKRSPVSRRASFS